MRKHVLLVSLALTLTLAACGGGGTTENKPTEAPGGAPGGALTGTVSGKISFDGTAPKMDTIQMSADPYCAMANKEPMKEQTVQVSDGGLENVIVYVSKGLEGKTFPTPTDPLVIDQTGCHYVPHAFTIMVGQPLQIKNSDSTTHNIHMYNGEDTLFNVSEPVKDQVQTKTFDKEMTPVSIRCDVHKWMNAKMGVFSHPSHTVSKKGGAFEFKVPPGTYEVTAWHEKYGEQKMMVTVADNGKAELNFTFKG
jgi:plastocyanin